MNAQDAGPPSQLDSVQPGERGALLIIYSGTILGIIIVLGAAAIGTPSLVVASIAALGIFLAAAAIGVFGFLP